jgi:hypothetical protein
MNELGLFFAKLKTGRRVLRQLQGVLSVQVRRAKGYLYLSALLLVVIMILLMSWMEIPSYLIPEKAQPSYHNLVRSISTYYGVQYMLILCSYYIPVSIMLSRRIRALGYELIERQQVDPSEKAVDDWEEKSGLLLHDLRSYKAIAALFAPLFTGIVGSILTAAAH